LRVALCGSAGVPKEGLGALRVAKLQRERTAIEPDLHCKGRLRRELVQYLLGLGIVAFGALEVALAQGEVAQPA
jgi:hypothetical protein